MNTNMSKIQKTFASLLLGLIMVTPLVFIPNAAFAVPVVKAVAGGSIILVALIALFLSILHNGAFELPKVKFILPLVFLPIIAVVSSFTSGVTSVSLSGIFLESSTVLALALFVIAFILGAVVFKSPRFSANVLAVFMITSVLSLLTIILKVLSAKGLFSFGWFDRVPVDLAGSALDVALLLGAASVVALLLLSFVKLSRWLKILLALFIACSIIFISTIGFSAVVVALGVIALALFVYKLSFVSPRMDEQPSSGRNVSIASLLVVLATVGVLLGGSTLSGFFSRTFLISSSDVRPNISSTFSLIGKSWSDNLLLGAGPNQFSTLWNMHKPLEVNTTAFWATDFRSGSGFMPTLFAELGLLGTAAFLVFSVLYLYAGFRSLFVTTSDNNARFSTATFFLVSLFFWVMSFIYVPGFVTLLLTFLFTGFFATSLSSVGLASSLRINVFRDPRTSFVSVFVIMVLIVGSASLVYFVWQKTIASVMYGRGVVSARVGDNTTAFARISRANAISPSDLSSRAEADIAIGSLQTTLGQITARGTQMTEGEVTELQNIISTAIGAANDAIIQNKNNYLNWFYLTRVYEILAQNRIEGALENAKTNLAEAQTRAPNNPALKLTEARLEAMGGNTEMAREKIKEALSLKRNYTDAYFTLAQLEVAENNIAGAIESVEAATIIDPGNAGLYFQLGLLKYNRNDFVGASRALTRAKELVLSYANARYFLGLSEERLGRRQNAIVEFEWLVETNPENAEVAFVLSNLKAGKSPFTDARPPITPTPEDRPEPPIDE